MLSDSRANYHGNLAQSTIITTRKQKTEPHTNLVRSTLTLHPKPHTKFCQNHAQNVTSTTHKLLPESRSNYAQITTRTTNNCHHELVPGTQANCTQELLTTVTSLSSVLDENTVRQILANSHRYFPKVAILRTKGIFEYKFVYL